MIKGQPLLYLVLAALVMGLGVGVWAGVKWQRGETAVRDNVALRAELKDLRDAAAELRAAQVELASDYAAAVERQGAIAEQLEQDREQNRDHFERQRAHLAALLEHRPDLSADRAGADVLCHWRRANAGPAATATAAGAECDPAAPLPEPAAAAGRPLGDAARKPRRRRGALPRLQRRQPAAGGGRAGMAAHGVVLVLRRPGARRAGFGGVRE